jgi:hypothetical protein
MSQNIETKRQRAPNTLVPQGPKCSEWCIIDSSNVKEITSDSMVDWPPGLLTAQVSKTNGTRFLHSVARHHFLEMLPREAAMRRAMLLRARR